MTAQPAPAIRVQGIEKSYKDLHVLRGVDFDVARGSIFALLGSNGAGKTTVIRILSTLLRADAGAASVNGFDVATQAAEVRESFSLTGQFAAVDEILSGRENLVLVARLRHLKDSGRARILEPRAPRPDLRLDAVRALAQAGLRVGVPKLQACLKAQNEDQVRASMKEADSLGVSATPTLEAMTSPPAPIPQFR